MQVSFYFIHLDHSRVPFFHSYSRPAVRSVIKVIIVILFKFSFLSREKGISIEISTSKMMNRISTMKYWDEKGSFDGEIMENPHSKGSFFVVEILFLCCVITIEMIRRDLIVEMVIAIVSSLFVNLCLNFSWKLNVHLCT